MLACSPMLIADYETPRRIKVYLSSVYKPFKKLKWTLVIYNVINIVVAGVVWIVFHYKLKLISSSLACQIHLFSHICIVTFCWLLWKVINKGKLAVILYFACLLFALPILPNKRTTSLDVSAANSRLLNRDCLILEFYDFDDLIDFLRAVKMFLFFVVSGKQIF